MRADLRIAGERIGETSPALSPELGERVLDLSERVVILGLVTRRASNSARQDAFRKRAEGPELLEERVLPLEAAHDEASTAASADLGIAELLLGGTTANQDMGTVQLTEVTFERAAATGLRFTGGKAMMDVPRRAPAGLRETTRESLDASEALARRFHGGEGGRLRHAFAARFAISEEALRETARIARGLSARIHTHASENPNECRAVRKRTGLDNVEYFEQVRLLGPDLSLPAGVWLSGREERLLAESGTQVVHAPPRT